jgi:LPS sulfotransferase NodH
MAFDRAVAPRTQILRAPFASAVLLLAATAAVLLAMGPSLKSNIPGVVHQSAPPRQNFVVILASARSASTTLVDSLNDIPGVVMMREILSTDSFHKSTTLRALNMTNGEVMARPCLFRHRFMQTFCSPPYRSCGFKIFASHVDFDRSRGRALSAMLRCADGTQTKTIVLERRDRAAQYASFRRAMETGNWGTSPSRQAMNDQNHGYVGVPPSFAQWSHSTERWYDFAHSFDALWILTETLIKAPSTTVLRVRRWLSNETQTTTKSAAW